MWQSFAENVSHNTKKYTTLFFPEHQVYRLDTGGDGKPIRTGEAYCRIWLVEMCLAKDVKWFKHRYPVVHTAVRFHHAGEPITIPYIAAPVNLRNLATDNLDKVIQSNYPLTPLFPFNQSLVEFQAGLFSIATGNSIRNFIKTMGRFSKLLPVPELSRVLNLVEPIYQGIEDLFDIGDRCLELGYQQTFSDASGGGGNFLRDGYFAAILAEENKINTEHLYVVNDSLKFSESRNKKFILSNSKSLEGYSYMLFRIEKRTVQDWESLTSIRKIVNQAQDGIFAGKYEEVKTLLLPAIKIEILRSPDIAKADRKLMILKIEDYLQELGLQSSKVKRSSLYSIMQRPLPDVSAKMQEELSALEKLFDSLNKHN